MPPLNKMNQQWHSAYAHMSNHIHVILRIRPDVVALWSDQEVARRWLALFPGHTERANWADEFLGFNQNEEPHGHVGPRT